MRALMTTALCALVGGGAAAQEMVTLQVAGHGDGDIALFNELVTEVIADDLAAAGIEVEYSPISGDLSQFLLNALSAGTAPDLFYTDIYWSDAVIGSGRVAPLEDADAIRAAFAPNLVEAFERDGEVYALAKDFNTLVIHYNRDAFDDAGVDYPADGDTWAEFEEKLAAVAGELGDIAGMCVVPDYARFAAFALGTGWEPFDADGRTVLDDRFRRAFEFYTGLVESGAGVVAADQGEGWTGGCMGSEKAAVAIEGAWMVNHLRTVAPSMSYGSAPIPVDPETGEAGNLIFTVGWTVNADGAHVEAAQELARLLTSEKVQTHVLEFGHSIPSRTALQDNPYLEGDSNAQVAARLVMEGLTRGNVDPYYFGEYGGDWLQPVNAALNAVLLGEQGVDEALAEAQAAYDAMTGG